MQPVQLFEAIIAEPQDSQVPLLHSLMKELPPTTMLDVLGDRTPLMMAAQHGCVEVMAYLLREACADPNTRAPGDGFTALHCAAAGGSARTLEAIGLLLSCGGDRDVLDDAGRRPLDVLPALVGQHEQEQASTVPDVLVLDQPELDFDKPEFKTADFRMFSFKVADCPLLCVHDWTECPYAHPGEKARRRDPQRFKYCGAACPDFRKGSCKRGDGCEYAHGVFECWLHPSRYRTQVCKDGSACNRKVCFFAHSMDELRQSPEEDEEAAAALASATSSPGACDSGALPAPAGHSSAHPSHHDLMSQCFSPSGSDLSPLLLQGLGEVNSTPASAYSSAGPSSPRAIPVPPAPPPAAATPSATPPGSPTPLAASAAIAVAAASAAQQAQPGLDANGLPVLPDGLRAIHDAAAAAAAAAAAGEHVSGGQLSLLLNGKAPGNPHGGGGAKSQAAALALGRLADPNLTEDERLAHAVTSLSGMLAQIQVNQAQQQHLAAQCAAGMMPGAQLQHLQQQAGAHHPLHNGGGSGGYPLAHLHAGGGGGGAGHYRERRLSGGAPYTPPLSPNRSGYSTPPTAAQMRAGGMARSPPLSASHFHGMANNARGSAGPSPPASPPITPPMSPRASRAPSLAHMLCPAAADAGHGFGSMQDMAEMRGLVGQHQQHLLSPSHLQQQQQRSQGSPLLYLPPQAPPPPPPPPAPPPSVQQRHLALSALAAAVQLEQQQLMAQWSDLTLAAGQMPVPQQQAGRSMVGGGGPQQWHNEQRAPTMQVSSFPQQQPAYPQQSASYQQQSAFQPAPLPFFAASHPRMSVSAPSSPPAPSHGFLGGGTLSSHGGNMSSHGGNMSSHGPPPPPPPLQHPGWASAPLSPRLHTPQSSSDGSAFWGDGGSQTATCL